jgi:hypothetical protein
VHTGFWEETPEGRSNTEDLGVDGRIMLKWIFRK